MKQVEEVSSVLHIEGNLVEMAKEGHFDYIFHGCNCFCVMKSGIAAEIADTFLDVRRADLLYKAGDRNKLGKITLAYETINGKLLTIVNIYTQYLMNRREERKDLFEYEYFKIALQNFKYHINVRLKELEEEGKPRILRLGFPYIGAGLAGGNWEKILKTIEDFAKDLENCEVVVVKKA